LVERLLAKEEVVGPSPIARSVFLKWLIAGGRQKSHLPSAFYSGDVAKWQGKGLQNPHQGFKSPRRLYKGQASSLSFFFSMR
jgi:hypothetical protein